MNIIVILISNGKALYKLMTTGALKMQEWKMQKR